jgi:ABC-type glutathione transport system ATPase component
MKPAGAIRPSKGANGEDGPSRQDFPNCEANVMHFIGNLEDTILPIMVFLHPLVAIVGGITMGIVRTMTQSRIIENAQRERIAAIQAGSIRRSCRRSRTPISVTRRGRSAIPSTAQRRRTNGLMVGGLVTLFTGIGLAIFFLFMDDGGNSWAIGVIPGFIGLALLLCPLPGAAARRDLKHPAASGRRDAMRLSVRNVGKLYQGRVRALDDFSLDVEPGVLGLLGPNGAGKSTLMKILATITRPTTGTVTWNGEDIVARPDPLRAVLGYLPQDFGVYPHLDAVEFLEYLAAVKRVPRTVARTRIPVLLRHGQPDRGAQAPLGGYSGGMRQRIGSPRRCSTTRTADRRRAHRRARSRESACASARCSRARARPHRAPLDPHRLRPRIDRDAHRLIDQGRLVADGTPEALLARATGPRLGVRGRQRSRCPRSRAHTA